MAFFSVIIPTYNRAGLISKTLESILSQQLDDFEVIVVDDGSTDNTEEIVNRYMDRGNIHYYKKKNGERGAARNFGTAKAKGVYLNFFDSDDLMYPSHLLTAKKFIEKSNSPEIFHLSYDYKSADGNLIYCRNDFDEQSNQRVLFDNILSCNGIFLRKDIAIKYPFEENTTMASAEDWGLWVKILARFKILYCNSVTSAIIAHELRSINTINLKKVVERDAFLIQYLSNDQEIRKLYNRKFEKFKAERFTFAMLLSSELGLRKEVLKWGLEAFKVYPSIFFTGRFLASVKNILVK